jgi:hypothetical protein
MNELEQMILNEKLKENPNFKYIRWLQQLNLESLQIHKNNSTNNFVIPK